jgi:hypothetical protein
MYDTKCEDLVLYLLPKHTKPKYGVLEINFALGLYSFMLF